MADLYCSKCQKTFRDTNFYQYRDGTKCELCKQCLTMHINPWKEDTFLWVLEKFDIPYVPADWNGIREKELAKKGDKMTGMTVFGKYLGKTKLNQYKDPETGEYYRWADTERLQEKAKQHDAESQEKGEKMMAEMEIAYQNGEISEAQWMTYRSINEQKAPEFQYVDGAITTFGSGSSPYPANDHPFERVELPDVRESLTEEDKVYLALKWGRLYSAEDWVALEKSYSEYEQSFDLHNADLITGTKQLCKLDLRCNAALDSGDIDSYSKLARASDALRKSLKFTEAQRKEDKVSEFNCYGQIVAWAEANNDEDFIPMIDLSIDRDIVDADIRDIKNFTKSLIEEDPAVFKMIEQYIKKREVLEEQEQREGTDAEEITDEDLKEYADNIAAQIEEDWEDDDDEFI